MKTLSCVGCAPAALRGAWGAGEEPKSGGVGFFVSFLLVVSAAATGYAIGLDRGVKRR